MKKYLVFACLCVIATGAMVNAAWTWFSYGGHNYALTNVKSDWWKAEAEAVSAGGHLVTINDAAEDAWVWGQFPVAAWIGLYQPDVSNEPAGGWVWISGDPSLYRNWHAGEPNNSAPSEEYAEIGYPFWDGTWNDWGPQRPDFYPIAGIIEVCRVPAPGALLLGSLGMGLVGWMRRRNAI